MALQRAIRFSAYAGTSTAGAEVLAQIHDETRRIADAYTRESTITIIGDLVELQGVTFSLIESNANPQQKRDLYLYAGIVSGLLAEANEDLGKFHASRIHGRTAFLCAENASHDSLRAWALFQQMSTAYWGGSPQEAIRHARVSADLASRVAGSGGARVHALEARAWAALGNSVAAQAALNRATEARDRAAIDDIDEIGGHVAYPLARQLYHTANALTWMSGHAEQAEQSALEALQVYSSAPAAERSYIPEAACQVDLAIARVGLREIEGARDALQPVFDLPPARRAEAIRTSLQRLHGMLRRPEFDNTSIARDLLLEIDEFCQFTMRTGIV
ncbi:hypothetical protein [Streptosporangium sp. LJ11]|uniref:hypothetical protein n=1 Tax=Streptosporangium sp. LJ11 TaxID=3436927 RepID=UPI003F7A9064